jgi:hypothetical protein
MTEVLIQQLNNSDINWMLANGSRQQLASTPYFSDNKAALTASILCLMAV